ncbi:MAG: hypothetical protein PSX80_14845 [bacterium]|nr:hypothetical protein [bacterium]
MIFVRGDVKTEELVPIDDAVPVLVLPELGPPESLRTLRHVAGLNHGDFKPNVHTFPIERDAEHLRQLLAKYQADAVEIPWEIDHEDFRRMLAKIAMCEAIFCFGYQQFEEIYLRSAILGNDRTSYWVGSDGAYDIYLEGGFDDSSHVFAIMRPHGYTEVWTRIKLWNKSMTPEYLVVVGRLRPSYARFLDAHHLIA